MASARQDTPGPDQVTQTWIELTIRLGVLALLLYLSFTLIWPFLTIAIWSIVLTVALYPAYERIVRLLGGRRLAAFLITLLSFLVVLVPAAWLTLGLIDSVKILSGHFDLTLLTPPPPSEAVKSWPLIGERVYQFWTLASDNLQAALARIAPHLKPLGGSLLAVAAGTREYNNDKNSHHRVCTGNGVLGSGHAARTHRNAGQFGHHRSRSLRCGLHTRQWRLRAHARKSRRAPMRRRHAARQRPLRALNRNGNAAALARLRFG